MMATFQRLSPHCWYFPALAHRDWPNIGYIAGSRAALLFDAGASQSHAETLRGALQQAGLAQPQFVALSHWHWDHTFGLHAWQSCTIAGSKTNDMLRRVSQWSWEPAAMQRRLETGEEIYFCDCMIRREYPQLDTIRVCPAQMEFTGALMLDLGGVHCRLLHIGGPHCEDSVVCLVEEDGVIFLGDSNGKDLYGLPWVYDPAREAELVQMLAQIPYDSEKARAYLKQLQSLPFTLAVDGHAPPVSRSILLEAIQTEIK